ncbi:MAG: protein kinase, partial [Proteobacteria bacterium]|nr:protein kinase [Pseudomonadota bacterium]
LNVLLNAMGDAKISDFGHSKCLENGDVSSGRRKGTRGWRVPEMLGTQKQKSDKFKLDIYSFGVILWEMVTYPYVPPEQNQLAIPKNCSRDLSDIMDKCWQREEKKPATAEDLAVSLGKLFDRQRRSSSRVHSESSNPSYPNPTDLSS